MNLQQFHETRWLAPAVPEWPPLFSYIAIPVIGITLLLGGWVTGLGMMEYALIASAFLDVELVYGTRLMGLLCSLAVIPVLWWSLPQGTSIMARVAATLLWILSPVGVEYGAYGLPETALGLAAALCVLLALRYIQEGRAGLLVWSGVFAGVAAAFKYNGGMVCVATALAALMGPAGWRVGLRHLALAGAASLGAFLVLTPTILLDTRNTIEGLLFEREHLTTPRIGPNYIPWIGTVWFFITREPGWLLAAVTGLGFLALGLGGRRRLAMVASVVIVNYVIVGGWARMDPNYWFPSLAAASLLMGEAIRAIPPRHQAHITGAWGGFLLVVLTVLHPPDPGASNYTRMSEWLAVNLPPEATIVRDGSFTPKVWTPGRLEEFQEGRGGRLSQTGREHFQQRLANSPLAREEVLLIDLTRESDGPPDLLAAIPPGAWVLLSTLPMERTLNHPPPNHPEVGPIHKAQLDLYQTILSPDGPFTPLHAETTGAGQGHFVYQRMRVD